MLIETRSLVRFVTIPHVYRHPSLENSYMNENYFEGYAITIMFGGDLTELEVLENSIKDQRSIILIRVSVQFQYILINFLFICAGKRPINRYVSFIT